MKNATEENNFLFNEKTRFTELLIMSEMESEEEYEKLKSKVLETVYTMYDKREKGNFFMYALEHKGKTLPHGHKKIKLGFSLNGFGFDEINAFTFTDFIKHLNFRVTYDEKKPGHKGPMDDYDFPLVAKGLLEAVEKYNFISQENDLQLLWDEEIDYREKWKKRVRNLMSK